MPRRFIVISAVAVSFALLAGQTISGKVRKMQRIPEGTWGAPHIVLLVEGDKAKIEYDCANGVINGPLKLDSAGHFKLTGTHTRERHGPIREDQPADSKPVTYTGSTDGKTLTLTVEFTESKESIGTFTLKKGEQGRLWKCK